MIFFNLIKFVGIIKSFDSSTICDHKGELFLTKNVKDLDDYDLRTGICVSANNPSWITFELESEIIISRIAIGGYIGNPSKWWIYNGRGAKIFTLANDRTWIEVGQLPNDDKQEVIIINLESSKSKYLKFQHNDKIGIGYLRILNE